MLCFSNLSAEPPAPVKVKQVIGSIIRNKGKIQTGSSSRIELELPYLAIVRIGSNAELKFSSNAKELSLSGGTMLMSMPVETSGVSVESGAIVTSMSKGDFQMSNIEGQVKVITLNGKVVVALAANSSDRRRLRAGEMVDVPAGATSIPPATAIKLVTLLKTSTLFNMGPLPSSKAINKNATKQAPPRPFITGGFNPDWGGGVNSLTSIGPAGTAAMVARMQASENPAARLPPLAPNSIPTQSQLVAFEAAGVSIPSSNRRALTGAGLEIIRGRIRSVSTPAPVPPLVVQPTPIPVATPRPFPTRPPRPGNSLPRPPILQPPIAVP